MRKLIFALCLMMSLGIQATERNVKVYNPVANINLAGTLALPEDRVPKALVVLASGSGAQNRDEEVLGQRPFKVISDTLVAYGYGVLRCDDRGVGESEGDFNTAILDDFTSDALSGVSFLRNLYPHSKVGILGHSQGGQVAVKAASKDSVDFIVTLAAPAWKGDSLIMSQARAIAMATSGSWPNEGLQRNLLDIALSDLPPAIAKTLLYNLLAESVGSAATIPEVQTQLMEQVAPLVSPMYRDLLRYDPENDIKAVRVPWIALNGDRDLQVLVENLYTIKNLNSKAVTIVMPEHNHLFQKAVTGLMFEYPTAGKSPSDETLSFLLEELEKLEF